MYTTQAFKKRILFEKIRNSDNFKSLLLNAASDEGASFQVLDIERFANNSTDMIASFKSQCERLKSNIATDTCDLFLTNWKSLP